MGQRFSSSATVKKSRSTSRLLSFGVAGAIALAVMGHGASARAQSIGEASATHAKRAQVAYDIQDWPTAIHEFQAAYQAEQRPELLWGLAQAQRLSGDLVAAIGTYKAYRRHDLSTGQSTAAELQIMKCEAEITKREAEAAKSAAAPPTAPQSQPPSPPGTPPRHEPTALTPAPSPARGSTPFYADIFGDVLFVGGLAAAGIGTYYLVDGNRQMRQAGATPVYRDYNSAADEASKKQFIGVATIAGGGLLLGGAVLRYLTMGPKAPPRERSALLVGPTSVSWLGTF